jgi:hypothetical protein
MAKKGRNLMLNTGRSALVHHSFCKSCVGLPEASVAS